MERSLRLVGVLTPAPRRAIPHFDIRYSIFDILRFAFNGSFIRALPLAAGVQSNQKRNFAIAPQKKYIGNKVKPLTAIADQTAKCSFIRGIRRDKVVGVDGFLCLA